VQERTAALTASHERLRASDRLAAVGTMAAGLAHDMAGVLLPLTARTEELLAAPDTKISPDVKREVAPLVGLLDHLRDMARNLSLFARDPQQEGTAGRTDFADWRRRVSCFIEAAVQEAPAREGPTPRPVRIRWDIPDRLPPVAVAPHRLTQAVQNLVLNARAAILASGRDGNGAGCITIQARPVVAWSGLPEGVTVKIIDDGIGMDAETVRRSTEPFYSGQPSSDEGAVSIGLGLALVHTIVQRAGGKITIDSTPGRGTTVTLTFRAAPQLP
jgi:signal transduction histidine kinase